MGYFLFFMRFAGVITRYVNGAYGVNISHLKRIQMVTIFSIISFVGIATASLNTESIWFFYLALFSSIFIGVAQAFGEAIIIGFLKVFPTILMGDFGSGTGFTGPFATVFLLVMRASGVHDAIIFAI